MSYSSGAKSFVLDRSASSLLISEGQIEQSAVILTIRVWRIKLSKDEVFMTNTHFVTNPFVYAI